MSFFIEAGNASGRLVGNRGHVGRGALAGKKGKRSRPDRQGALSAEGVLGQSHRVSGAAGASRGPAGALAAAELQEDLSGDTLAKQFQEIVTESLEGLRFALDRSTSSAELHRMLQMVLKMTLSTQRDAQRNAHADFTPQDRQRLPRLDFAHRQRAVER